jgi:hypothetical protein
MPAGDILLTTRQARALREPQLAMVSPATSVTRLVPLAEARDGT